MRIAYHYNINRHLGFLTQISSAGMNSLNEVQLWVMALGIYHLNGVILFGHLKSNRFIQHGGVYNSLSVVSIFVTTIN